MIDVYQQPENVRTSGIKKNNILSQNALGINQECIGIAAV